MASVASKTLDFENSAVEFAFANGQTHTVNLADFSDEMKLHFALHGISQKLGDSYSSSKGDPAAAEQSFIATLDQLKSGEWRAARGEGDSKPRTTELAEAIARIKGQPLAEVTATLAAADEDTKKTLRANPRVKAVIAVIRAEKAQAKLEKLEAEGSADLGF
jgi:hypothetical protein